MATTYSTNDEELIMLKNGKKQAELRAGFKLVSFKSVPQCQPPEPWLAGFDDASSELNIGFINEQNRPSVGSVRVNGRLEFFILVPFIKNRTDHLSGMLKNSIQGNDLPY